VRFTHVFLYVIFFALCVLLFFPSLNGEFIMDDWGYITENPWVTAASGPWAYWTTFKQTDFWPLSYTFYWIFYRLFGETTLYYHLVNLSVHALNAVLVFVLASRFSLRWPVWVALLFLVHPLHVQAVSWIIQFKTLLSTALALGCMVFYLRFLNNEGRRYAGFALAAFILAVLAKTSVISLPLVLLALQWRTFSRGWPALIPFFVVGIFGGLTTLWVNELNFLEREAQVFHLGLFEKLLLMTQNFLFYLKSFFYPVSLAYMYPLTVPRLDGRGWALLVAAVFLTGLSVFYWRYQSWRQRGLFAFGYLVLLFPALGLVPIPNMKLSLVADHWAYLPDVFLALYAGAVFKGADSKRARAILMLPIVALALITFRHSRTFASEEAFWRRASEINPHHAAPAYNLGTAYGKKNLVPESIEQYRRAVQLDPSHYRAWYNLGRAYVITRDFEKAEECLRRSVQLNNKLVPGYLGLSKLYELVGARAEALRVAQEGLAANPGSTELAARTQELKP